MHRSDQGPPPAAEPHVTAPGAGAGGGADAAPAVLVVVPAHDEEPVIRRGVRALLAAPGVRVRVLVVANGCTDATADRARELGDPRVEVVELAVGGKAAAVRAGLERAHGEDVVAVVDADVVLDEAVLGALADALAVDEPRIAAPARRLDTAGCSPLVRRYYRVWSHEPAARSYDIGGRGVYAVNRAGLERLRTLPDVIADDGWARARFAPHERVTTHGVSTVRPAQTLRAQVLRQARVLAGNRQLRAVLPPAERPGPPAPPVPGRNALRRLREEGPVDTAAWYAIELPARTLTAWRRRRGVATPWSRDETTRR